MVINCSTGKILLLLKIQVIFKFVGLTPKFFLKIRYDLEQIYSVIDH